ncbi:MAG: hypothetical protein ACO1SX_18560 [Actinomycetota bacterium]
MMRAVAGLAAVGILLGGTAAWAETALKYVTPQNIQGSTFSLKSKAARNNAVEFVIRRDVSKVDGPGRSGYLANHGADPKSIGTPVKLEQNGKSLTFRFSVPADKVAESDFTLWGGGQVGEGVTYRFKLGEFWKPKRE